MERALAPHRRRYEAEVEALVRAAFAVIRRTGSASPTVGEILAEAGLSTTAFYRHFPTKDALLVALLERAHETTREAIDRAVAAEDEPVARVDAWVRAFFALAGDEDALRASRPFLLAHPHLLAQFPADVGAGADALVAGLTAVLQDAVAATGTEAGTDTDTAGLDVTARLLYHLVFGLLIDSAALATPVPAATVDAVCAHARTAAGLPPLTGVTEGV